MTLDELKMQVDFIYANANRYGRQDSEWTKVYVNDGKECQDVTQVVLMGTPMGFETHLLILGKPEQEIDQVVEPESALELADLKVAVVEVAKKQRVIDDLKKEINKLNRKIKKLEGGNV